MEAQVTTAPPHTPPSRPGPLLIKKALGVREVQGLMDGQTDGYLPSLACWEEGGPRERTPGPCTEVQGQVADVEK